MWSLITAPLLLLTLQTFGLSEWMKSFTAFNVTLLIVAQCVMGAYRMLCWTSLIVWYTPTGCCVEHFQWVWYTPTGCVEHCSLFDLHLQDVVLNIAHCLIYTYRVLCWTFSVSVIQTYRLCWTLLIVWFTPTGCCVEHCSVCVRYTPTGYVEHCSVFDIHIQSVVLNIAHCLIYIYRMLCWTLFSVCEIHTYRLCWTFLSVWYTHTGCCVEHSSVFDIHLQGVVLNNVQCVWYTPTGCVENFSVFGIHIQGVVLNIVQCLIYTYRVLCWTLFSVCDTHLQVMLNISKCLIYTYRMLCWTLLMCDTHIQDVLLNIAQFVIHTHRMLFWTLLSVWYTLTGWFVGHCSVCDIHLHGVVLNIAQCVRHTYRVLCWTSFSV